VFDAAVDAWSVAKMLQDVPGSLAFTAPSTAAHNPLVPSDPYIGRTAQLTSRRCILNTYSTNIRAEYFKRAA
jgi:hypothetical protein